MCEYVRACVRAYLCLGKAEEKYAVDEDEDRKVATEDTDEDEDEGTNVLHDHKQRQQLAEGQH